MSSVKRSSSSSSSAAQQQQRGAKRLSFDASTIKEAAKAVEVTPARAPAAPSQPPKKNQNNKKQQQLQHHQGNGKAAIHGAAAAAVVSPRKTAAQKGSAAALKLSGIISAGAAAKRTREEAEEEEEDTSSEDDESSLIGSDDEADLSSSEKAETTAEAAAASSSSTSTPKPGRGRVPAYHALRLCYLPVEFQEPQLFKFLNQFGAAVLHCFCVRSRRTHQSKGIAYVQFDTEAVLPTVVEECHGMSLGGRSVQAKRVTMHRPMPANALVSRRRALAYAYKTKGAPLRHHDITRVKTPVSLLIKAAQTERRNNRHLKHLGIDYQTDYFTSQLPLIPTDLITKRIRGAAKRQRVEAAAKAKTVEAVAAAPVPPQESLSKSKPKAKLSAAALAPTVSSAAKSKKQVVPAAAKPPAKSGAKGPAKAPAKAPAKTSAKKSSAPPAKRVKK